LKENYVKNQVLEMVLLKGIQETIAGFINDHVLPKGAEFYYNPASPLRANQDESLYDIS
jgi:hypothetical protein